MRITIFWRIISALTLLNFGVVISVIILYMLANPILIPAFIFSISVSLYGAWLIFTGQEKRLVYGWLALLVGIVIFVTSTLLSTRQNSGKFFIAIVILVTTYSLLVSILKKKYWELKRDSAIKQHGSSRFNKPYLIVNPKSGNGRAIKANIPEKATSKGIEVKITNINDNISGLARRAVKNGADVLGVSGGDGTIGAVATVAIEYNIPLVVLPGGTRCHFARDTGLDPKHIEDSLNCFEGIETKIDVGSINGRIFLNNASLGLYADIVDNDNYREHKVATSRTVLQKLLQTGQSYPLKFKDNNNKQYSKAIMILVGVNAYKTINLLGLGKRDNLSGHVLQITVVKSLTDILIKSLLKTAILNKDFVTNNSRNILQWEGKKLIVSTPTKKIVVGVDGEREEYKTPVKIELLPSALRLMTLPEGLRYRPKNIVSTDIIKILWRGILGKEI